MHSNHTNSEINQPLWESSMHYSCVDILVYILLYWTVIQVLEKTYVPTHKIPKDIQTIQIGHLATSVDVAASYRFADFMWVSKYRKDIVYGKGKIKIFFLSYTLQNSTGTNNSL